MLEKFLYRPNCELCGSDKKKILFSKEFVDLAVWNFLNAYYESRINKNDLADAKYEIAKCSACGFIWQTNILNDELTEKLYGNWISPEQSFVKKKCADISLFYGYAREVRDIFSLLSVKPCEIDVLDFGMGWGHWCLMAKAFGCNARGFEISGERVQFARKNGIEVIDNFAGVASYKFDFINAEQVFEHINNPLQTLKFLARSLKNGGLIHISVPNGNNIERELATPGWKITKNPIHPLEHINCFTHRTLVKLGESAGLEPVRQLFLASCGYGLKSYIRGILGKNYQQYFGTSLYFKKKQ